LRMDSAASVPATPLPIMMYFIFPRHYGFYFFPGFSGFSTQL
jgi:hypothetical protein